ncbi:MAG: hypothetical protein NTV00_10465 [Methylococcales bacterium]|nr:hypothetical protein [Methylococcales bacterium]
MKSYPFYKLGLLLLLVCHCHLSVAQDQEERLTVNATTTDVKGYSPKAFKEANKIADIFLLQKQLVYKLLQNIGITSDKLSPELKAAINKPHTANLKAFTSFCNCLDLLDKGEFTKAREQCDDALKNDPNFILARRLRESIPDKRQSMAEIVSEHMNRRPVAPQQALGAATPETVPPVASNLAPSVSLNSFPVSQAFIQLPSDIGGENCQSKGASGTCQVQEIDKSAPACDDNGHCGFYATFLAQRSLSSGVNVTTSPFMTRIAVSIPPTNASGAVSINQIGQEGKGNLNLQLDPSHQTGSITGFQNGQLNQGNKNIPDGALDRIVTQQFSTQNKITGLELGAYLSGFDFNNRLGTATGNQRYDLFHGAVYFAEGQVTPIDTIKNMGKVQYDGVVNADFSVNGNLVPCQGTCGHFTSTLNYGAAKLETFNLEANARQVDGNLTAAAQITANNIAIRPNGEFQFDQTAAGSSFKVGETMQTLVPAEVGNVAGQPFGSNADQVGGVFAIQDGGIQGAGNFGGNRK